MTAAHATTTLSAHLAAPARRRTDASAQHAAAHQTYDAMLVGIATACVVADIGSLTEWLASECADAAGVDSDRIVRFAGHLPTRIASASLPELLHVLLTCDTDDGAAAARRELLDRYLRARRGEIDRQIAAAANTTRGTP